MVNISDLFHLGILGPIWGRGVFYDWYDEAQMLSWLQTWNLYGHSSR